MVTEQQTDTSTAIWPRGQLFMSRHARLALTVAVVLALGGIWLSFGAIAGPSEATEQQSVTTGEFVAEVDHEATVEEPTALHEPNTTLVNQPLYFSRVTPELTATLEKRLSADADDPVSVTTTATLRYGAEEDGSVYWEDEQFLASTNETLEPGTATTTPVTVNVTAVAERINDIESDLAASPGQTVTMIEVEHVLETDDEIRSVQQPIEIDTGGTTYSVGGATTSQESFETTETVTTAESPPLSHLIGGPTFLFFGIVGALAAVQAGRIDEAEREHLAHIVDRERYDDVIVRATLPETGGREVIVHSLADLAKLAIDLDSVITYDPDTDRYVVPIDRVTYVFEPEYGSRDEGGAGDAVSYDGKQEEPIARPPAEDD